MKATKEDFLLAVRKASFRLPESFLIRGMVGGARVRDIAHAVTNSRIVDSTMVETAISGTVGDSSLRASVNVLEYRDFPAVTLTFALSNDTESAIQVEGIRLLEREFCGDQAVLVSDDDRRFDIPLPPPPPPHGQMPPPPGDGAHRRPPSFDLPRYFLSFEDCTVMIEYQGEKMFRKEPLGASIMIGKHHFTVDAGQTLTFAPITFFVTDGDVDRCRRLVEEWKNVHFW